MTWAAAIDYPRFLPEGVPVVQNRVTFGDAAYVVLVERGEPTHYKELAREVLDRGLFKSRGKTPEQTLRSQIAREVNTKGDESRWVNLEQGIIDLSERHKAAIDQELIAHVLKNSGVDEAEAVATAAALASGAAAPSAEAATGAEAPASDPAPAADVESDAAPAEAAPAEPAPAKVEAAPSEPAPAKAEGAASEAAESAAAEPAAVEADDGDDDDPDLSAAGRGFIPIQLDDVERADSDDDEDDEDEDGTFATAERDPVVHEAPSELAEGDDDAEVSVRQDEVEEDSEQDFLSTGELDDMTSLEYETSMEELAPIVVPPHEGGAAEIARIPLGYRTGLIVKVVRRDDKPQLQLVEELESLVSGVVGRLLLTLPGDEVEDLTDALLTAQKVIDASFTAREEMPAPPRESSTGSASSSSGGRGRRSRRRRRR